MFCGRAVVLHKTTIQPSFQLSCKVPWVSRYKHVVRNTLHCFVIHVPTSLRGRSQHVVWYRDVPFLGVPFPKRCGIMGILFRHFTKQNGYPFPKFCGIMGQSTGIIGTFFIISGIMAQIYIKFTELWHYNSFKFTELWVPIFRANCHFPADERSRCPLLPPSNRLKSDFKSRQRI